MTILFSQLRKMGRYSQRSYWLVIVLVSVVSSAGSVFAQVGQTGQFTIEAVKTDIRPRVDGVIENQEWNNVWIEEDFIQFEPQRGARSEVQTFVSVLYDDTHLYVAFKAYDSEDLMSQMTQRDAPMWGEDSVHVYLDSFYDRRSGYYFMTNVLGTQTDGRLADDGTSIDQTWDAPWESAARRTEYGYSVEIAIPFSGIKYVSGNDATWGINFSRTRQRTLERSHWSGPVDHWGRISQAGVLTGLDVPSPARRYQLIPYALSQAQASRSPDASLGLDLRYAITSQSAAYVTINPDFATIEADQEEVNLTRFELSLAEKRQFFLEGQELFQQRIQTFYSRRITDIGVGAKLLGKQGPWAFALLSSQGKTSDKSFSTNYTVARIQRDVSSRSNVGFLLTDRHQAGRHQGAIELDANLFFTETFGLSGQLIKSYGQYSRGGMAFEVRPSYDSSTAHAHLRYTHLGDRLADNVNVLGFIRDDDRRELDSSINKTFWPQAGSAERIRYNSNYNVYWGQRGTLRSWQADESLSVDWRNRWSTTIKHTEEFKQFEKDFRNRQTQLELGYNTRAYQSVRASVLRGRNFDADFRLWAGAARYKITSELSAEYELQRLTLNPDPRNEGTWIHVVRASQFFTKDLFLRVFFQTNSVIDRRNIQAVFVYRYLPPFGTIQLAFQRGTAEFGTRSNQGNTLFVKATTVF